LSEEKGNSTRRLFSKSNTFFTQEEENKEGVDTVPYNSNANEQSMSQATEPRFLSIEHAQGREMARATIQLTKSPDLLKKMDQS
jgi:hypothetical protein